MKKILIVDDSAFDRELIGQALRRKGDFETLTVASGEECLQVLSDQKVDLVLMDILMPGLSGDDVLTRIRQKFNAIDLPIIMVTAKDDPTEIVACLKQGANDYITKPVNFEVALMRISTHLKLADLSREMSRLQRMSALAALVTTYNHEINNPLAIAIALIGRPLEDSGSVQKIKDALWRMADIVKKIGEATAEEEIEFADYSERIKMLKLKSGG